MVLQFFPDGDAMVVTAANDGGDAYPGWYHNLRSEPDARVEVKGRIIPVRAQELSAAESAAWWPRIVERDPHYARYRRTTSRPFPVLRLTPRAAASPSDLRRRPGPQAPTVPDPKPDPAIGYAADDQSVRQPPAVKAQSAP